VRFTVIVKYNLDNKRPKKIKPVKKISNIPDIWPAKGYLTLTFGDERRTDKTGMVVKQKGKIIKHKGVDIAAKRGSKVIAPATGKVIEAKIFKYYGKMVILDHGNGYISKYAHLDELKVKKGKKVKKGSLIGLVGSTGTSTAPHLHWEVHYKGKPVDPLKLIKE
ncbi:MAG: M23 family metallopeptidase, partial [Candidatus Aminicenantes bacterium]|nr:M23 family metallopeptidase [Candidatus Aminicenantes bacterium]